MNANHYLPKHAHFLQGEPADAEHVGSDAQHHACRSAQDDFELHLLRPHHFLLKLLACDGAHWPPSDLCGPEKEKTARGSVSVSKIIVRACARGGLQRNRTGLA